MNAERLPWELALDHLSLARRSSIRSNDSSIPSRDRPESMHNFGKSFFHRRGKSKRESSAQISSASSLYSGETTTENPGSGGREGLIPSIFSRRRPSRDEAARRRPYISGPFNFQHVTHTRRDTLANSLLYVNGSAAWDERFTGEPGTYPSCAGEVSSESVHDVYQEQTSGAVSRPPLVPRHAPPSSRRRRVLGHIRSPEQVREKSSQPPPRPPRSPVQADGFSPFGPLLPCRVDSRQSSYQDITDAINMNADARTKAKNEVRQPFPFGYTTSPEHVINDFKAYESSLIRTQDQSSSVDNRHPPVLPGARDSTWPLAISAPVSYETLPDVPEEGEQQYGISRPPRLSLASNKSSLRGSQSAPTLRSETGYSRPTSVVSETLGDLGIVGLDRDVYDDPQCPVHSGRPTRESWEDLIDYCYEHEAEANCDYEWDRPSLDTARDTMTPPGKIAALNESGIKPASNEMLSADSHDSPSFLGQDAPPLSPASFWSTPVEHEVVTPNSAVTSNFSLPRCDRKSVHHPLNIKDDRLVSGFSTFKESQAFMPSPSFPFPRDYQQQMPSSETEKQAYPDFDLVGEHFDQSGLHENTNLLTGTHGSSPLIDQRCSTSTMETNSTSRSNSTGRQYRSTNSSWTTLARCTASSSSLNKMAGPFTDESEPLPTAQPRALDQNEPEWADAYPPPQNHVPDMIPTLANGLREYCHKSHASESQVLDEVPPDFSTENLKSVLLRARTTSLGAQSPSPAGQFAAFSQTQVTVTGEHIETSTSL
ncbi:PAK-box/P21-Rho-binding protein [Metarhizium album ARSEF 1941]|uniref:PAK-box/P21-Rho-binding protein n=1 Tax=Metarhizium album (strain ARSEF 1941) TaxID=1081103 RepID=A0A0B2WNM9_METAS|nr:PAK-box/P21-Rho-binding protein [Metarhizium album ARSEF 1941]KHN97661.1 PAK-box/P21-Rho-binding protein [Metarhizium album ARSEF 1941]